MTRQIRRKILPSCMGALLAAGSTAALFGHDGFALPMHGNAAPAPNSVRKVTNCDDSGAGSLRDTISSAVTGDVIDLTQLSCSDITLTGGAIPTAMDDLFILGPGVGPGVSNPLTIHGYYDRVFDHGFGTLVISGLKLVGGSAYAKGGCITAQGSLVIEDSIISGCDAFTPPGSNVFTAGGAIYARQELWLHHSVVTNNSVYAGTGVAYGGGIFASGIVTIEDSTISDNRLTAPQAYTVGGGMMVTGLDDVSIASSTISGNQAAFAGGIRVETLGHSQIINSTLSGNYASIYVGAASFANTPVRLINSTVTHNSTYGYSPAVYSQLVVTAESSIIADNHDVVIDSTFDICAPLSGGANLITASCQSTPADTITKCPRLTPLGDHGGPTPTHALIPGSPGIDKGSNAAGLAADQRGGAYARLVAADSDIGAYEWQGDFGDNIFKSAFEIACDEY